MKSLLKCKKAKKIITYSDEHGKFQSVDELKNVKGIGSKIAQIIKQKQES